MATKLKYQGVEDQLVSSSLHRQAIINGNFDVWQRGTTVTNPTTGAFLADRYKVYADVLTPPTNVIHSRQLLTSGDIPGAFYYYRVAPDGAGSTGTNTQANLRQQIEYGTRFLCGDGKKVTISFWARSSIAGKKIGIGLYQNYGSGGSPSSAEIINGESWTLTSSWVKYTTTITTNTLAGKTFGTDNNDYLQISVGYFWDTGIATRWGATGNETYGGNGTIDIAQVQLCAGDVALPFMPKSFGEELRACQRYCYVPNLPAYTVIGSGMASATTEARILVPLPTTMRTIIPTLTATAGDYILSDLVSLTDLSTITNVASGYCNGSSYWIICTTASVLTQYRPYFLLSDATANRLMIISAEL